MKHCVTRSPVLVADKVDRLAVVGAPGDGGLLLLLLVPRLTVEAHRPAELGDPILGLVAELQALLRRSRRCKQTDRTNRR